MIMIELEIPYENTLEDAHSYKRKKLKLELGDLATML